MSNIIGKILVLLGTVLIITALGLLTYNGNENREAEKASYSVLTDIKICVEESKELETKKEQSSSLTGAENIFIPVIETEKEEYININGYDYIGYISIPKINTELPIMADWDYDRLKIAPCRHFGTLSDDNIVIAGHNYISHFGKLTDLNIGDEVIFTDALGEKYLYKVGEISSVVSTSVETVKDSEWELVLYTCNYSGNARIAVFCEKIK